MSVPDSQEKHKSPELFESGEKTASTPERKVIAEAESGKESFYKAQTKQAGL